MTLHNRIILEKIAELCEEASEEVRTDNEAEEDILTKCDALNDAICSYFGCD